MSIFPSGLEKLRRKCRVCLACALFSCGVTGSAWASDFAGGTLTVFRDDATADCPDEVTLGQATLALGTPPPERAAGVDVSVEFQRDAFGYGALVRTLGPDAGVRELRKPGPTCAPLAEAVAVVLTVVFDLALRERSPEQPSPVGAPPPTPRSPPPSVVPAVRERAAPMPAKPRTAGAALTLAVGAQGGGAYGLLGNVPVGVASLAVRLRHGRWELGAGALWAPNRTVDYRGSSVYLSVLAGRLAGCGWLLLSRAGPDAALCAGALLGRLRGAGDGFDDDFTASEVWLAAEAGVAGRLPLSRNLALRLGISLLAPSLRHEFTVARAGTAFRSSRAAGLLELGAELCFP